MTTADAALDGPELRRLERSLPIALLRAREHLMRRFRPLLAAHDLTEQLNLYKGRCANLQRDVQLGSSTMERLNSDQGSMAGQIAHYKSRIQELEDEKARAERARRRFESRNERLEQDKAEREKELSEQKEIAKKKGSSAIEEILKRKQSEQDKDGE